MLLLEVISTCKHHWNNLAYLQLRGKVWQVFLPLPYLNLYSRTWDTTTNVVYKRPGHTVQATRSPQKLTKNPKNRSLISQQRLNNKL